MRYNASHQSILGLVEDAKTLDLVAKTDVLREYYNSEIGAREGAQNFMWTGAFYVAMTLHKSLSIRV